MGCDSGRFEWGQTGQRGPLGDITIALGHHAVTDALAKKTLDALTIHCCSYDVSETKHYEE